MNFSLILMNKNCVQKSSLSPKTTVDVGQSEFCYSIVNFDKKRSVPKEIPFEVEFSVVKMIIIMRDDCITNLVVNHWYLAQPVFYHPSGSKPLVPGSACVLSPVW